MLVIAGVISTASNDGKPSMSLEIPTVLALLVIIVIIVIRLAMRVVLAIVVIVLVMLEISNTPVNPGTKAARHSNKPVNANKLSNHKHKP
jgi:hypothetical protein